jgi:FAD:protein FMN transferase
MELFKITFPAMGGYGEVNIAAVDETEAERLVQPALEEVRRIERKYSRYREDSVIGTINKLAGTGEWVTCDEETISLLKLADTLYRDSEGYFDITSGVLRQAWDFNVPRIPAPEMLAELCAGIGWLRVERESNCIRLPDAGMELDFGGFGKEYAADRAAAELSKSGVQHGFVNLSGDIRVVGPQPDGNAWVIGIQDPRTPGKLVASIPMNRGALATSGDYERYFELDGKRYCHVINPRTGCPVTHWRSISVIAPDALTAGCYSTIAMLMEDRAAEFLRRSGLMFLGIDQDGTFHRQN